MSQEQQVPEGGQPITSGVEATQTTAAPTQVNVSWSKETDGEPGRDFIGIVISGEYPYHDEKAKFEGEQIRWMIQAEQPAYENLQPCWIPPSNKRGTKFAVFRNAIAEQCPQAWRELLPAIQSKSTPYDQLMAFVNGLVGMRFRWVDKTVERPNPRPGDQPMRMLIPIEYKGRGTPAAVVTTEKVQL